QHFREHQATLATSELFTAGQLAHWFSAADGGGAIYRGGVVRGGGEGSSALGLAQKARQEHGATYGLGVGQSTKEDVEGAWHDGTSGDRRRGNRGGHPAVEGARVATTAINLLRRHLLKLNRLS